MKRMSHREALEVVASHRRQNIVVTTMTSVGIWPDLSDSPLDFAYLPSAMGHAPGIGLGLALAQNRHGVIVLNGDGGMLMNLGSLVTLAGHAVDLYLIVFDNGQYEVTGGQPTAGDGRVDFAGLAKSAGFRRTYAFDTLDQWRMGASEALQGPGPVMIVVHVEARLGQKTPKPPRPMAEQIARLQAALQ